MVSNLEDRGEKIEIDETLIVNLDYFNQMKECLCCSLCTNIITLPRMCSECEVPYCSKCISVWYAREKTCPLKCKNSLITEMNRSLAKIFNGLKLKCKFGCQTTVLEYTNHVKMCEDSRKPSSCFNCGSECKLTDLKYRKYDLVEAIKLENEELKKKVADLKKQIEEKKDPFRNPSMTNSNLFSSYNSSNVPIRPNLSNQINIRVEPILLDSDLKALMETWINSNLSYQLLYKGTQNDFKATTFHSLCDNKGPTIVIMKTNSDKVIGGFTPLNWVSPQNSGIFFKDQTEKSFVFSFTLKKKYALKGIDKLAICCNKNYGPIFGNYDLLTVDQSNIYNCANCDIGSSYDFVGDKNSFYGSTPFQLKEIEVYLVSRNI